MGDFPKKGIYNTICLSEVRFAYHRLRSEATHTSGVLKPTYAGRRGVVELNHTLPSLYSTLPGHLACHFTRFLHMSRCPP